MWIPDFKQQGQRFRCSSFSDRRYRVLQAQVWRQAQHFRLALCEQQWTSSLGVVPGREHRRPAFRDLT
jgi:hypothetical protein